MDSQSWIGRYVYFGVFEDFLVNGAGLEYPLSDRPMILFDKAVSWTVETGHSEFG